MMTSKKKIIFVAILDIVFVCALAYVNINRNEITDDVQKIECDVKKICELATLDCYYHNVSEWENPGDFFNAGKKLWMEYDGIVRVGVKGDQVHFSDPDGNGVVTVTMPSASILSKDLDESTIYEIDSESPLWGFLPIYGNISTEERREALAEAQNNMEDNASRNEMILSEAKERAKKVIENVIVSIGEANGEQYTVKFIDEGELQNPTSAKES